MILEHSTHWPAGPVYVGCSGNLTIERTLAGRFELHSNDVNPYSCALGWYFAGEPLMYQLKEESADQLAWMQPYLDNGIGTLACLLLGSRFLSWVGKPGAYYRKMVDAYAEQFERAHAETVATLAKNQLKLASFFAGDVREHFAAAPREAPLVSFPPFWAGGYETMFKGIEQHFVWPKPDYQILSDADLDAFLNLITDRPNWMIGVSVEHDEPAQLDGYLRGLIQTSNRNMPIRMYASDPGSRVVRPRQTSADLLVPKIGPDDELGDAMTLLPLKLPQFNSLRSQFLAKHILPGSPALAVAVLVDGHVVGAFAASGSSYDRSGVYLMSDFPVGWTRYRRLAKLVVMAAMSAEAQRLYQRALNRRITNWSSTAFTDRPNSAKYGRGIPGVWLQSKNEDKGGERRWKLGYGGPVGCWTLNEALEMWKNKHGKDQRGV